MTQRTTMQVTEKRKQKLERAAIEISYRTGKPIKWTELANKLFDEKLDELKKDMINERGITK
ncbi:hypothetical protein [Vibrio maritimus]|uniref:hypothetical protein n=1 Tax=Vibrio maritimus TaxID=990268 RepID=UPI001F21C8FB|nr:hypothetical protein [Vibrio maritimus]